MLKLLFVISQLYKGGAETSLVNLLKQLGGSEYSVDLLVTNQIPVENAVSLIPKVPSYVNVCDAYAVRDSIKCRISSKYLYKQGELKKYSSAALNFVRNKVYDWAFHVGEWWSPEFVAERVAAKHKAVWIHTDLSKAEYFDDVHYFDYLDAFEKCIFVSQNSMESSIARYPFLKNRSVTIYNINDSEEIRKQSTAEPGKMPAIDRSKPLLVTVANIRPEKKHLRQVEAMHLLQKRGIDFTWLNIGSTVDETLVRQVKDQVKANGLEDRFLFLGPRENPYPYMKAADAVTVLSDYESWSMVITEAKILGVPVISTPTSGALEQITDGETGLLTGFDAESIADRIEVFLRDAKLREKIRHNLNGFDNTQDILDSFHRLVSGESQASKQSSSKILYVIDDINYSGGAHVATKLQIEELLKTKHDVTIFSNNRPTLAVRNELSGAKFLSWWAVKADQIFSTKLLYCLRSRTLTKSEKRYKLKMSRYSRREEPHAEYSTFEKYVFPRTADLFSNYDIVCVMSEGSSFKKAVADCTAKRKIQWIHTDYCYWRNTTEWSRRVTKDDEEIWKNYDTIVVLAENIRQSMVEMYPHFRDKITVLQNIMPIGKIRSNAEIRSKKNIPVHFVTVGRVDFSKAYERLAVVLANLLREGYCFNWDIIGDGEDFEKVRKKFGELGLENVVKMRGLKKNPFPYVKKADVFALLSEYEGLPNTIYEAFILGKPVVATRVGGISTQVQEGWNGWLADNNAESIYQVLEHILNHHEEIECYTENLKSYQYDNEKILDKTIQLFDLNS